MLHIYNIIIMLYITFQTVKTEKIRSMTKKGH